MDHLKVRIANLYIMEYSGDLEKRDAQPRNNLSFMCITLKRVQYSLGVSYFLS